MGFDKSKLVDVLRIPVTLSQLFKDENGQAITFVFELKLETEADIEALQKAQALNSLTNHESNVLRLSRLLASVPTGFDDFQPDTKALASATKEYFADPRFEPVVRGCLNLYNRAVMPDELFR